MIEDKQYLNYVPQELKKSLHSLNIDTLRNFSKELLLDFQYSLFHIATKTGDLDIFNVLLDLITLPPLNSQRRTHLDYLLGKNKKTPFHLACEFGHLQIAEILMGKADAHDIESDAKDDERQTAFHLACKNGHSKLTKMLIEKSKQFHINLNDKNERNETAFHLACKNGQEETSKSKFYFLVQFSLEENSTSPRGNEFSSRLRL